MNEITKYQNRLNTVNFTGFGRVNSNLFFTICTKARGHEDNPVKLSFSEIRKLSGYTNHSNEALMESIKDTYSRMLDLNIRMDANDGSGDYAIFTLFHRFDVLMSEQAVEVRATPELKEILNDFTGEWTAFRLEEYVSLKSTYAKHMYRLLKQWRTIGGHAWKIKELRELLEIPETYDMRKITQWVLAPIQKELSVYFKGLTIEKIKTGRRITAINFSFQQEDNDYVDIPEREDTKSKQQKIDDLNEKIENGREDLSGLRDQIQTEKDYMDKKGIPDKPKKSLFERFFRRNK